jgi:hydroxymethylglutaryl-CoA reductase (NADPH)
LTADLEIEVRASLLFHQTHDFCTMATDTLRANNYLERLLRKRDRKTLKQQLQPKHGASPERIRGSGGLSAEAVQRRWKILNCAAQRREAIADAHTLAQLGLYQSNIENGIGTVKVPVGVAGPLRVNGLFAQGDYYVPLATTEAALVASYHRGSLLLTEAGGCAAMLLNEGISRAPGFAFLNLQEAGEFVVWALSQRDAFRQAAESTSRHAKLIDMRLTVEGNHVYLNFEYLTGDAAGQNMVTIATQKICDFIVANAPVKPRYYFVEANLSGDKKASVQSFLTVRGKKVTAECLIPAALIKKRLHTTTTKMFDYWRMSALGGVMSGTIGVQGHYANGLAALYLATGQDVACVAESAVGVTRFEVADDGALYAAVTLPNLIVGTVGGGTGLPSQRACLEILGLAGNDKANALAEVAAALALAGELSIIGALCAGHFTAAHERLARGRKSKDKNNG